MHEYVFWRRRTFDHGSTHSFGIDFEERRWRVLIAFIGLDCPPQFFSASSSAVCVLL